MLISLLLFILAPKLSFLGFDYLAFTYLPFFVIGFICRDYQLQKIADRQLKCKLAFILPFIFVYAVYLFIPEIGSITHNPTVKSTSVIAKTLWYLGEKISFLSFGLLLVFSLVFWFIRYNPLKGLSSLGKESMIYYIYHGFIRTAFLVIVASFDLDVNLVLCILASIVTLFLIYLISPFKFSYWLMNPFSKTGRYLINWFRNVNHKQYIKNNGVSQ